MTTILALWAGLLLGFVAGAAWGPWVDRRRPVGIGALDDAYQRGVEDGRRDAWAGHVIDEELRRMWEQSS